MTDFRLFLQQELLQRCRKNPAYSLRAFAQALKIEPSALSKIIRGKREVTKAMFQHLCEGLQLDPLQAERMNPNGGARDREEAAGAYRQLSVDFFQVIADWYHYAILELTALPHFRPDPRWIAKTLGITVPEVNAAAERLVRLEMLEIRTERGKEKWIDHSGAVTTVGNEFTTVAFRKLQKQVLEMSIQALETVPYEKRDQSSMTMAIDSRKLPEAKRRIARFRRTLCRYLKNGSRRDSVYQLSVSLFPLTDSFSKRSNAP